MTTISEHEQYDIQRSYGHIPAAVRSDIEDYNAGQSWGRTEGVRAVPSDTVWDSITGMHYAQEAFVQCARSGMSERFCRGAFDAVYRALTWGDKRTWLANH